MQQAQHSKAQQSIAGMAQHSMAWPQACGQPYIITADVLQAGLMSQKDMMLSSLIGVLLNQGEDCWPAQKMSCAFNKQGPGCCADTTELTNLSCSSITEVTIADNGKVTQSAAEEALCVVIASNIAFLVNSRGTSQAGEYGQATAQHSTG